MPRTKKRVALPRSKDAISRKALKNAEFTYWGEEPTWNPLLTESETSVALGHAFNWYNAMSSEDQLRKFLLEYAKEHFPDYPLRGLSEDYFIGGHGHIIGILARCASRGANLSEKHKSSLADTIRELSTSPSTSLEPTVQERRDPKVAECIGLVESLLDDCGLKSQKFPTPSMADSVLKAGATNAQRLKVQNHFSPRILELETTLSGKDPDLKEAYAGMEKFVKKMYAWMIAEPSEELVKAAKKPRKPRQKKAKTAAQILKRFECKEKDDELKITSIDAQSILGAEQLWVFNTKTRRLGVYHCIEGETGLSISRKSITNYDEKASFNKKIRKPAEVVPSVISAGKVALRHLLDNIRATATPMKCRINADTLLLRVIK